MADLEKITINLTPVDLGRIDILVEEGFYQNRSDFIRASIRRELEGHDDAITAKAGRYPSWEAGVVRFSRQDLEALARDSAKRDLFGLGSLTIERDAPSSLVDWVFGRVRWYGPIDASSNVKSVLGRKAR
jgi:Arc/MetJ-type ribon-helix-helix transcriptional regulator